MAKKNNGDQSLAMSKGYFDSLTKISLDNIRDFFGFDSVFFVIESNKKNSINVLRSFLIDRQYFKSSPYIYKWYWGEEIKQCFIKISKNETDSDYNDRIEAYKKLIKDEINNGRMYAKRIV